MLNKDRIKLTMKSKRAIAGYLFISPFLLGLIVFFMVPVIQSLIFSFSEVKIVPEGYKIVNQGFKHYYKALFVDPSFVRALTTSIVDMVTNVPILIIFSFFTATLINQKYKGRSVARAIIFLPVILTSGVIMSLEHNDTLLALMRNAFNAETGKGAGVIGTAMQSFELRSLLLETKIDPRFITYITGAIDRIYELISSAGVQILIFLAGLQSIPASVYEASDIEGASGWVSFWKITFPMISPLILVNMIYTIICSFTVETNEVMSMVRLSAFRQNEFGYSAAMAWIYFLVILIVMGTATVLVSKRINNYD